MDKQQKLLVIGVGSKSDLKAFEDIHLGEESALIKESIDSYFSARGIKVYQHPTGGSYLVTSIHRTTEDAIAYAKDMKKLSVQGHRIACVLYGGLAFALPGVVAAEAPNVPVIAVGAGKGAFYGIYEVPDGTAVGVVGVGSLAHGLAMAEKILNFDCLGPYEFLVEGDCPSAVSVQEEFAGYIPRKDESAAVAHEGMTICLTDNPDYLRSLDKRVRMGIFGLEKNISTEEAMRIARDLGNSVLVGRPKNLALYASRIIAGFNPTVNNELVWMREKERENYPPRMPITLENFV